MLLILTAWWILIRPSGDVRQIPQAMGPYPSEALCQTAGHDMMPSDDRFWTAAQRVAAEVAAKKEAERELVRHTEREKIIAKNITAAAAKRRLPAWIDDGDNCSVYVLADQTRDGQMSCGMVMITSYSQPPSALSSCTHVP